MELALKVTHGQTNLQKISEPKNWRTKLQPGKFWVLIIGQIGRDNRCGNLLGRVDDLLDPGDAEGDVHAGHARKVERFQGHLGARLTSNCRAFFKGSFF